MRALGTIVLATVLGRLASVHAEGVRGNPLEVDNVSIDERLRMPSLMSDLGACSSAPACGVAMASIDRVPAKSNGGCQCGSCCCGGSVSTGCAYQCVEFAQRYMHQVHGIQAIWPVRYAKEMCTNHPSGVRKTSNPKHGDLAVFSWSTAGHVAVVNRTVGTTLHVLEQNASPTGVNKYDMSQASCFLTAS